MTGLSFRARLTLWHSGLLAALVLSFAVASYVFLRRSEIGRVDRMLHEQAEIMTQTMATVGISGAGHVPGDTARLLMTVHDLRARGLRAWVFSSENRLIVSTAMVKEGEGEEEERWVLGDTIPAETLRAIADSSRTVPRVLTIPTPSGGVRLSASSLPTDVGPGTILVSQHLRDLQELLAQARTAAVIATALAILVSLVAGYALARRSLAPVAQMSSQADRIGASTLHERLPIVNPHDELGALARTLNALLDRLKDAFDQQRRFMADASHELRTPVAIMRGEADVALAFPDRTREEYRDALGIVRDAASRLTHTVNDVFLMARVDAGQVPPTPAPLYFDEIVAETCRATRSLSQSRGIEVIVDAPDEIPYVGDASLLGRLVLNVVENAIKYSDDGRIVRVRVAKTRAGIALAVTNTGRGIPPGAHELIFERFYRVDAARTHQGTSLGSGTGLGLPIARWIAQLHGGTLQLTDPSPDSTTFTLTLPLEPVLRRQRTEA